MFNVVLVFDAASDSGCLFQNGLVQGEMGAFIMKVVGPLGKHIYVDDKCRLLKYELYLKEKKEMSVKIKRFHNAFGAIQFLENLAHGSNDTIVFRGHPNQNFRLINTWQRHRKIPHEPWMTDIDEAMTKFKIGVEKLGLKSHNHEDRFEALEHARHHGVPTPCLDFSYSPYVALFFAFNEVRRDYESKKNSYSVVYALNVTELAQAWARSVADPKTENDKFYKAFWDFQSPPDEFLEKCYPAGILQFFPFPGKSNVRMQRQLGALLYDSLHYKRLAMADLEEYLEKIVEPRFYDGAKDMPGAPVLYKVFINQRCISEVFERLELMNITGGNLYNNADGVAMDIKNHYYYNAKFSYLRDVKTPIPDDMRI